MAALVLNVEAAAKVVAAIELAFKAAFDLKLDIGLSTDGRVVEDRMGLWLFASCTEPLSQGAPL